MFSYCFILDFYGTPTVLDGVPVLDYEAFADSVVLAIKSAVGPLYERLASIEARIDPLSDVRDRLVSVETKAAVPLPIPPEIVPIDLGPVLERLAAAEARIAVLGDLRDRVVVVETKAAQPIVNTVLEATPVDLSPVLERLAAAEARLDTVGDLRDRVVVVETKAAQPVVMPTIELPAPVDVSDVRERLSAVEMKLEVKTAELTPVLATVADLTKDIGAIRERIAVVEVRPPLQGVQGEPGIPGRDGRDGVPGTPGLAYQGVYQDGKSYDLGQIVTWAGSTWHANETTTAKPGEGSKSWTLMVKRGRDGRDGVDASATVPVVAVGRR